MFIDVHKTMLKASQMFWVVVWRLPGITFCGLIPRGRKNVRETSLSKLGTQRRQNIVGCFSWPLYTVLAHLFIPT